MAQKATTSSCSGPFPPATLNNETTMFWEELMSYSSTKYTSKVASSMPPKRLVPQTHPHPTPTVGCVHDLQVASYPGSNYAGEGNYVGEGNYADN